MKVMVVGGGGREHALVHALNRSSQVTEVFCTPGNAGIARDANCLDIGADEVDDLLRLAHDQHIALTVVGPEAPLIAGIVDAFLAEELPIFGPSAAAARLEGSKIYAKELMATAGVPTARHRALHSHAEALDQIQRSSYPTVLKADGLAAGKGVVVATTYEEARAAIDLFFVEQRFGEAGSLVVMEELLEGEELSLLAVCDGKNVVPLASAQDYKRIFDDDRGPNTGGMGSYSPVAGFDSERLAQIVVQVHQPIVDELRNRGTPFHGVLYAGLMVTTDGPRVLEFNCRFGDPEAQAVLPRLKSDLADLMLRSTRSGGLADVELEWAPEWATTVVMASRGYPESSSKGDRITGIDKATAAIGVEITHAGTALVEGEFVTAGGRVLAVTALGDSPAAARERAYCAADMVSFAGKQQRSDIAARAVERVQEVA